ncbi:MAG: hypothetical protein ACKOLA_05285, partial [Spartobacteria bacterium]
MLPCAGSGDANASGRGVGDGGVDAAHFFAAEFCGEGAHDGGFFAREAQAGGGEFPVGGADAAAEFLLGADMGDGLVDVRAEFFDVVGLVFFEEEREEGFVGEFVGGLERVPAGGDDGGFVDACGPVDRLDAFGFAFPERGAPAGFGDKPDRAFGSEDFSVGSGAVAVFDLLAQGCKAGDGVVMGLEFREHRGGRDTAGIQARGWDGSGGFWIDAEEHRSG